MAHPAFEHARLHHMDGGTDPDRRPDGAAAGSRRPTAALAASTWARRTSTPPARRRRDWVPRCVKAPTDIPNVGRFAVLSDPQGATFAVFTPGSGTATPGGSPRRAASPGTSWRPPTCGARCASTASCSAGARDAHTTWAAHGRLPDLRARRQPGRRHVQRSGSVHAAVVAELRARGRFQPRGRGCQGGRRTAAARADGGSRRQLDRAAAWIRRAARSRCRNRRAP